MEQNNVLNAHFRTIDPILMDPPDVLANPRPDLTISTFQCDATSSNQFTFAATIRNIGSETTVIPATLAGGSITFGLIANVSDIQRCQN